MVTCDMAGVRGIGIVFNTHQELPYYQRIKNELNHIQGSCFCRAVEIEATGAPAKMGYSHCRVGLTRLGS